MTPPPTCLLNPALLAMVQGGVSVIVGACGRDGQPSVMRAVGSQVSADGQVFTVYLARSQSRQLLQDLADTGRIAVVFSRPSSHATVQVKASAVRLREANAADEPVLQRYLQAMEREIALVGFEARFVRVMLAHQRDDLVAVEFTPDEAYDQAPGPRAGERLAVPSDTLEKR